MVVACGGPPEGVAPANDTRVAQGSAPLAQAPAERVACAVGDVAYADVCTIERVAGGTLVTMRHPDGGFRRLRLSADGRDFAAADGAAPAEVIARTDRAIEVAVGDARYRLPTAP